MHHPDASAVSELRSALTGPWTLDRRGSRGDARFIRLTLYRDGRFGTVAVDGRTVVYGNWTVDPEPTPDRVADPVVARFTLRFDYGGPSAEYHLALPGGPAGPLVLLAVDGGAHRLLLQRALPPDAPLVGHWRAEGGADVTGPRPIDALELRRDGTFLLRVPGGVVRGGRWGFEREGHGGAPSRWMRGTLALDPTDTVLPRVRWPASLELGASTSLAIELPAAEGGQRVVFSREAIEPAARVLLGTWRLVGPGGTPAPQELVFRADGTLEVLARAGAPRAPGHWEFVRTGVRGDALEGFLTLVVQPVGHAVRRDRQRVAVPYARLGELELTVRGTPVVLRYRRLFK